MTSREYLFQEGVLYRQCIGVRLTDYIPWDDKMVIEIFIMGLVLTDSEAEVLYRNRMDGINTYGDIKVKAFVEKEDPYKAREITLNSVR